MPEAQTPQKSTITRSSCFMVIGTNLCSYRGNRLRLNEIGACQTSRCTFSWVSFLPLCGAVLCLPIVAFRTKLQECSTHSTAARSVWARPPFGEKKNHVYDMNNLLQLWGDVVRPLKREIGTRGRGFISLFHTSVVDQTSSVEIDGHITGGAITGVVFCRFSPLALFSPLPHPSLSVSVLSSSQSSH